MANKSIGAIKYSLGLRLKEPGNEGGEKQVYATAQSDETVTTEMLAEHIAEHNSVFSPGTIFGILKDMASCVREQLLAGKRVVLQDLCTVYVTLKSTGKEDANNFSASDITAVNVRFSPQPKMKDLINDAEFERVVTLKAAAAARKQALTDLNKAVNGAGTIEGGSGTGDPGDVTP